MECKGNFQVCLICLLSVCMVLAGCVKLEVRAMKSKSVLRQGNSVQLFEKTITKTLSCRYLLFLPEGYGQQKQQWPLILFLHGAGERGSDINKVREYGLPKVLEVRKDFPFIVVSPQCPEGDWWQNKSDVLINLLDEIENRYAVDKEQVYLTGLSMGGYGTWYLACEYPGRFAAIAPICGGSETLLAFRLKDVPVWAFHGAKDDVVPLEKSQSMVDAINACRGDVKFTIYPQAGHDSWTETYANEELYKWFLSHRISDRKK